MWLSNLRIMLTNREIAMGAIRITGRTITAIVDGACPAYSGEPVIDCNGLLAIAGLTDLYSDWFEREREPRPSSLFPLAAALHECDKRLAGAGITIAYTALTLDTPETHWRSRRPEHVQEAGALLGEIRHNPLSELHIHLRINACATDATATALAMLASERCDFVGLRGICERTPLISEAAQHYAVPLALHDPATPTEIAQAHNLGINLCIQPRSIALVHAAKACGMRIAMNAPDVVRGISTPGGATSITALQAGHVDFLVSDESPIALLQACFSLHHLYQWPLHQALALVSHQPADLLGFEKRSRIAVGAAADLLLVEPGQRARIRATMRAGEFVYRRAALQTEWSEYVSD
jgi:alpha-D-ribose 1-methylphosphonate 5-triphosphate diphosphatase